MKLLHELITDYAASAPAKPVVTDARGEMSYGELDARSAFVARALAARGVGAGDAAAVYVPYGKEIILGAVSALRAGGIYIPFDEAYPEERLSYMLRDSEAKAVLTTRELWSRKALPFPEDRVIFLDEARAADEPFSCGKALSEDSPAMLLYTSGTTGRPKGVLHTHGMLLHIVDWMNAQKGAEMNGDTRTGVMSGFSFVGTQMFLLGPLSKGGTVCLAPEAARKDLGYLYQFIREAGVTHIFLPSGLAAILAEDYDIRGIFVFAAGEKLRNFHAHCPGNVLINSYGCTETSGALSKVIHGDEERMLVGKPYDNTKAQVVNEALEPLAPGEAGELLISSGFMSHEYYKLPELSAEKWFLRDGALWYRTGDRVRRTKDGDYECLGRTDNMVKLRGFRIETGEVEAQVANAAVRLGRSDVGQIVAAVRTVGGTERLCCYYEAAKELDQKAITDEIAKSLAEYMVPDVWVRMDALPRNANGKVMRGELPQPRWERGKQLVGALDSEVVARVVWAAAEVLGTDGFISPDDRFTDHGGTSLTAMKFTARLREQGVKITSAEVLRLNVLRKIAEAAEVAYEQLWSREEYERVREDFCTRGEHIQKILPITPEQDEMLFEQILHPDRTDLRTTLILQMDSAVSERDLREALDAVADENEELRAAMVYRGVTVIQQAITDRRIPLEMIRADRFGGDGMEALRERLLGAPMDLQRSSLMRAVCVHAEGESFLCVAAHRVAFGRARLRGYLARLMELLSEKYPDDDAIRGWREVLALDLPADGGTEKPADRKKETGIASDVPPEICVYSENAGPKLVFVHTGNTGSAAYYRLASRIGGAVSFAVIEPFNLYHPAEARYGIKNIAAKYVEILRRHQPKGPYRIGGWCYGGVVAHEMACQLEQAGEEVCGLFLLDAHAVADEGLRNMSRAMHAETNRSYFETSPLFAELRENGMLEAVVSNAAHVSEDLLAYTPSYYHGSVTYFRPEEIPAGVTGDNRKYWEKMMEFAAGNYENFCDRDKLRIISTPHEHDLMMDDPSLDVIVPELMKDLGLGEA